MQQRNIVRRAILGAVGIATSMGIAGSALASSCATPTEIRAFQTRMLQTELMMAALACGESDRYNQFIRRFTPELTNGGNVMRGYFSRAYGGNAGATKLNAVMTSYANESSRDRTAVGDAVFCSRANETFVAVLQVPGPQMVSHAGLSGNANRHGLAACGAGGASGVQTAAVKKAVAPAAVAKKPAKVEPKKKAEPTKVAAAKSTGNQRQ